MAFRPLAGLKSKGQTSWSHLSQWYLSIPMCVQIPSELRFNSEAHGMCEYYCHHSKLINYLSSLVIIILAFKKDFFPHENVQ